MFKPVIHNLPSHTREAHIIRRYNFLITQKPASGILAEKVAAQLVWKKDCQFLLDEIRALIVEGDIYS